MQVAKKSSYRSTKRVSVDFTSEAFEDLEQLAESKGKTKAELIRDALALEKWFSDVVKDGGSILVERKGKVREVVRR